MKLRLESRPWQTNVALLLIGAGMFALARQLVSEYDHFTMGFSGVSGWSATLYILACVGVMFVVSFALTGLGFCIAWRMTSTQGFHAIMNLFLMPMWFLSGALFPPGSARS